MRLAEFNLCHTISLALKKSYSVENIHRVIANVLLDVEENMDIVIMTGHKRLIRG